MHQVSVSSSYVLVETKFGDGDLWMDWPPIITSIWLRNLKKNIYRENGVSGVKVTKRKCERNVDMEILNVRQRLRSKIR